MCYGCWESEGKPTANLLDTSRLALWLEAADGGGALHIFYEDWNCDDSDIDFCMSQPDITPHEKNICILAKRLPYDQRIAALALRDCMYGAMPVQRY